MKDVGTLKHGEEGTHWTCDEILMKNDECCGCTGHKCKQSNIATVGQIPLNPKSMKVPIRDWEERFDKEFEVLSEKNDYDIGYSGLDFIRKGSASEVGWNIKQFISSLLKEEREKVIEEVKEKIPQSYRENVDPKMEWLEGKHGDSVKSYGRGYNHYRSAVLEVLNEI